MTKEKIADAFEMLIKAHPYNKITINMICEVAHTSRNTFYYYFQQKKDVIDYICLRDYQKNSVPYHVIQVDNIGTLSFFQYLYDNKELYFALFAIDKGNTLRSALMEAYKSSITKEYVMRFSKFLNPKTTKIEQDIFWLYGSGGITAIQLYWIETGMKVPAKEMAEKLGILLMNSLFVSLKEHIF